MRKPPGYSEAPTSEIYVYNGKDWVLSSSWVLNGSNWDDYVFNSNGMADAGLEYIVVSDHALSRRPDRSYLPAPSGSHYRYDKANHSWILEGDGGSPIPTTDPTDVSYVVYDSNGNQVYPIR
jgi:hypothetical protein